MNIDRKYQNTYQMYISYIFYSSSNLTCGKKSNLVIANTPLYCKNVQFIENVCVQKGLWSFIGKKIKIWKVDYEKKSGLAAMTIRDYNL